MKHVENYLLGMDYEIFIRRAFNVRREHRRVGSWNEDFSKVLTRTSDAVDKFLSRRINKEERESLLRIKEKLNQVYSKESLSKVITEALKVTRRHKR